MATALKPEEAIAKGIRRIIRRDIEKALTEVQGANGDESIHSARKRFKRIRAALRLIRDGLPDNVYRRENVGFRNVSQRLTDLRDAAVLLETLEPLRAADPELVKPDEISAVKTFLETDRQAIERRVLHENAGVLPLKQALEGALERLPKWCRGRFRRSDLKDGFERVHKQAYRAFIAADAHPTAENLHEWRKKAKYGLYQLQILKKIWPAGIPNVGHHLQEISRSLGDYRDLRLLLDKLEEAHAGGKIDVPIDAMWTAIDRRLEQLQEDSFRMGRGLYGHGLKDLARQVRSESCH